MSSVVVLNFFVAKLKIYNEFYDITYKIINNINDEDVVISLLSKRDLMIESIKKIDSDIKSHMLNCEDKILYDIVYSGKSIDDTFSKEQVDIYNIIKEINVKIEDILVLDRKIVYEMSIVKDATLGNIKNLKKERNTTKYLNALGVGNSDSSIRYDKV